MEAAGKHGFCACGCGYPLPEPPRFLRNHNLAKSGHTVEDRGYETPCWIAIKEPQSNGYVVYYWSEDGKNKTRIGAHRVAYMRAKGAIPPGAHVHHKCRVPRCINPDHLEIATPSQNVRLQPQVKLNPDLVRMIRSSPLNNAELGRQLDVTTGLIWAVRARRLWKDVE